MADFKNAESCNDSVCIDAGRVYDSCCDRDCLSDLRCFFLPETQTLISNALSVRLRGAEVLNVFIDVEPVNFNKGYYSCDLTFFFLLSFDLYTSPSSCPQVINGIASFNKKVILYGSCGSVKTFSNLVGEQCQNRKSNTVFGSNTPKCVVSAVDPVPLSAKICAVNDCYEASCCIPDCVCEALGGHVVTDIPRGTPTIYATIGLFTVVQLIRNVQMHIPIYDFCIPQKSCDHSTAEPCDTFSRIQFPVDDFFPPRPDSIDDSKDCGCFSPLSDE